MHKFFVSTLLALGLMAAVNAADPSAFQVGSITTAAVAQENAAPADRGEVNVSAGAPRTTETRTTSWFVDPLWIALAVGAAVLIAVLFAVGSRGGGTTIVKN